MVRVSCLILFVVCVGFVIAAPAKGGVEKRQTSGSVEPILENAIQTLQKVVDIRGMGKKSYIEKGQIDLDSSAPRILDVQIYASTDNGENYISVDVPGTSGENMGSITVEKDCNDGSMRRGRRQH